MDTVGIIGCVVGIVGMTIAIATFFGTKKKDSFDAGKDDGGIKGDIKYMRNSFDELRLDVKEVSRKQNDLNDRVIRCEESCKQAHKRIDSLEHNK